MYQTQKIPRSIVLRGILVFSNIVGLVTFSWAQNPSPQTPRLNPFSQKEGGLVLVLKS